MDTMLEFNLKLIFYTLPSRLLVEREGYSFEVPVTFEKLPKFCTHCQLMGHFVGECRTLRRIQESMVKTTHKQTTKSEIAHKFTVANFKNHKQAQHVPTNSAAANVFVTTEKTKAALDAISKQPAPHIEKHNLPMLRSSSSAIKEVFGSQSPSNHITQSHLDSSTTVPIHFNSPSVESVVPCSLSPTATPLLQQNSTHKTPNNRSRAIINSEGECKISFGQLRRFSWRELQLATDNFSEGNVIGQGRFRKVYRGFLSDSTKVAVKRLTDYESPDGEAAFLREVHMASVAVHRNLLRLIGFCTTSCERLLVYPLMQNLSVAYCLGDLKPGEKGLDWPTRKRVALGAAHGLEYLHEHCDPKIIHRDVKAANILLDINFEAVLGDFGLAKLVDTRLTHITTQVHGTMGRIAPEYLSTGKCSEKTDVFGYGITLLELVTGQCAIDFYRLEEEEDVLLLDDIKKLLREKRVADIVDENLKNYDLKEVETIIRVALLCTQSSPEERPTMVQVVNMLQGESLAKWEQLGQLRS
ncbi:hypothetical protein LguiB_026699 [Lonicera macranthoides]